MYQVLQLVHCIGYISYKIELLHLKIITGQKIHI